jgi:hypothetical protein
MSRLGKLRKTVEYETDIPRCGNCAHYKHSRIVLRDSLPRVSSMLCKLHDFTVRPNAVCNKWAGTDGSTL